MATKNIARTVSGAAASTNATFPTVTVPLFEITGYTARHEANLDMVAYTPVVTKGQRADWQRYAVENMDWIEESRMFLAGKEAEEKDVNQGATSTNTAVRPFIWQMDEFGKETPAFPSPYLPMWQVCHSSHNRFLLLKIYYWDFADLCPFTSFCSTDYSSSSGPRSVD